MPLPPPSERTGVLVIRAWIETNGHDRLRARITGTLDLNRPERTLGVAGTADEITSTVTKWVDAFIRGSVDGAVTEQ